MVLNWEMFYNLVNNNLLPNTLVTYTIEKVMEEIVNKVRNHSGNTLEEQLLMCMESALEKLCQDYIIEYDDEILARVVYGIISQREELSEKVFVKILSKAIYLEFDETVTEKWLYLVKKVIAEKQLVVLRDYLLMQAVINASSKKPEEKPYPRILTVKPALAPEEYLDREEKRIVFEKLTETRKLVLVNGIGGIGKSTVCRKIFHELSQYSERTLAWIVYNSKDLKEDFRKQLFFPKAGKDWEKRFIKFLQQDIEKEAIIFIDNLNVSEEEEPFLKEIANANCNIICTSRVKKFQHYEVVPVSFFTIKDCVKLFYKYYKLEYDYKRIVNIVTRVGRHTLVIEILGKIGNAEGYTLQELQDKLDNQGFNLEGIALIDLKEDTLIGHLCRTFSVKNMNDEQKAILYCLAILPVQRISLDLRNWLQFANNYNINYLVKHAWFLKDKKGFYMHPVIKEVVKRMIEPQRKALKNLLSGLEKELSYKENPDYEKSMTLISYVEAVLPFCDDIMVPAQLQYNISMLYGQFGIYSKALEYVDQCINILAERRENQELLGSAYNHKGYICYYIFDDKQAEESYKEAYKIRKQLKNKQLFAQTISSLALLYQGMWREHKIPESGEAKALLEESSKYQLEAVKIFEEIFNGIMHPNLASAYNNMGELKNSLREYKEAEYYYKKAEKIRLQLLDEVSAGDLSVTYLGLCRNYIDIAEEQNNLQEKKNFYQLALEYIEKCIKIRTEEIRKGNLKLGIDSAMELQNKIQKQLQ